MLSQYEILTFALKGVYADIDRLERKIEKGRKKLEEIEKQNKEKKPESNYYEIKKKVQALCDEVKDLSELSQELRWKISEYEE